MTLFMRIDEDHMQQDQVAIVMSGRSVDLILQALALTEYLGLDFAIFMPARHAPEIMERTRAYGERRHLIQLPSGAFRMYVSRADG